MAPALDEVESAAGDEILHGPRDDELATSGSLRDGLLPEQRRCLRPADRGGTHSPV